MYEKNANESLLKNVSKQSLENVQSCNKTVLFFFNDWNTFRFQKISKINRVVSETGKKKFPVFLKKIP